MGRGLSDLQKRILVMANANRVGEGHRTTARYQVRILADVDCEIFDAYVKTLKHIHDRISNPWKASHFDGIDTSKWDFVHVVIEKSGIFSPGGLLGHLVPGTWEKYARHCLELLRAADDRLVSLGLPKIPEEQKGVRMPHPWYGRFLVSWVYSESQSSEGSQECYERLKAAGLDPDHIADVITYGDDTEGDDYKPPMHVSHLALSEVLADVYGFRDHLVRKWEGRIPAGAIFDRKAIGEARYNAATAAASKATRGLARRGLVFKNRLQWGKAHGSSGIILSEAGIKAAEELTASISNVNNDASR